MNNPAENSSVRDIGAIGAPEDNIGGQRSKFDVIATILHICIEERLKNHIIGKGNFSDAMTNHYLSILLYHNLLESLKDENNRTCYRTTQKGRHFMQYYDSIQQLFEKEDRTSPPHGRDDEARRKDGGSAAAEAAPAAAYA